MVRRSGALKCEENRLEGRWGIRLLQYAAADLFRSPLLEKAASVQILASPSPVFEGLATRAPETSRDIEILDTIGVDRPRLVARTPSLPHDIHQGISALK